MVEVNSNVCEHQHLLDGEFLIHQQSKILNVANLHSILVCLTDRPNCTYKLRHNYSALQPVAKKRE